MYYYEISARWQERAVVLDGREHAGVYDPTGFTAPPLPDKAALVAQLRYAAGIELGVMQEYLTAAYSLRLDADPGVADDIRAARAELMRVAIGEMRHLRIVNDVLRTVSRRAPDPTPFEPALGVADALPTRAGTRPVQARRLTRAVVADFIEIEGPSDPVDSLYGRILATLRERDEQPLADAIALIIAEGKEHFETFIYVQEWLRPHDETAYLIAADAPPAGEPLHLELQSGYTTLLDTLRRAYIAGAEDGASLVARARAAMLGNAGIDGACRKLADRGFLAVFETPADLRFQPVSRPA